MIFFLKKNADKRRARTVRRTSVERRTEAEAATAKSRHTKARRSLYSSKLPSELLKEGLTYRKLPHIFRPSDSDPEYQERFKLEPRAASHGNPDLS